MSGERWNHNYTSKATGAIISDIVSVVPVLCSHSNSTGRIYCMWGGEEFHLFSAEAGEPNEDLYLKWQESNETWQTCKSYHLNMSKQNLGGEWGGTGWETKHTDCLAGQLRRSEGEPRGASLRWAGAHGAGFGMACWWFVHRYKYVSILDWFYYGKILWRYAVLTGKWFTCFLSYQIYNIEHWFWS